MMNVDSIAASAAGGAGALGAAAVSKKDPDKVLNAAKQFEALLVGQLLKSMQDSEGGWMGTGEDQSASAAMEYGMEAFAQAMSATGGLGLAKLVAAGLEKSS
jgi:Rod binding domain-containing protein